MFKAPSFNKKKSTHKESFYQEGMNLVRGSLYKQATDVFLQALKENYDEVSLSLTREFNSYYKSSQFEAAASIGEALRAGSHQDAGLLVGIGNCYRQLESYQKANDLYREALRVDKASKLALCNLAASLAKVDKYDLDIKKTLDRFKSIEKHVLPPYLNDPDIVDKITAELDEERKHKMNLVESLQTQKSKEQKVGNTEAAKKIVEKIENEEKQLASSYYQAICKRLRKAIKKNWAKQTIAESKANLQENLFNLGLYALSQGDLELASDSFNKLESEKCAIENLDLMLAITLELKGYKNQAIDKLIEMLKENPNNRYAVVNLGLMYKRRGNTLLSMRYLLSASELLEQSGGLYNISDIEVRADEYFDDDNPEDAFSLYNVVINESPNAHAWNRIGEIHIQREEYVDATMAFHESLDIDPENSVANQKLMQIHDLYALKGDTQFRNGFDKEATTMYQNALEIHKSVEVMNKAIKAYKRMNDFAQVNYLKSEIKTLKQKQNEESLEKKRLTLIKEGKLLMKEKKFDKAIKQLESAFAIKPDKDTFLLLAYILKALKHGRKLSSLVQQWRQITEKQSQSPNSNE
ncbi:MAG: hypothetical protein MJE63_03200 [Proteobacteria bacterium]|nr:hypothetical protein [Pseudomonadota bacterium]